MYVYPLAPQDLVVPAHHLIGEPGGATVCMMRNLEIERVVLAAMGVSCSWCSSPNASFGTQWL